MSQNSTENKAEDKIFVVDLEDGEIARYPECTDRSWKLIKDHITIWEGDHFERGDRDESYLSNSVTERGEFVTTDKRIAQEVSDAVKLTIKLVKKQMRERLADNLLM